MPSHTPRSQRPASPSRSRHTPQPQADAGYGNAANARALQTGTGAQPSLLDAAETELMRPPADWSQVIAGTLALRVGANGGAVKYLQRQLNAQGAQLQLDGQFGPATRHAVMAYQRNAGVAVDGVVGRGTSAALSGGSPPSAGDSRQRDAQAALNAAQTTGGAEQTPGRAGHHAGPDIAVSAGQFAQAGLRPEVLSVALDVFRNAWAAGQTTKTTYSIIDFSMPSTEKRLFVMDLATGELLFHELVTHGGKSGFNQPTHFSNRDGSHMSSIGLARAAETYHSSKFGGTALRMDGLEEGYNDHMRSRAIVMHQADYATQGAIDANGGRRLGRSQGCPAMDPRVAGEVIDTIKNGSLVFSYYPDPDYLASSQYVNG